MNYIYINRFQEIEKSKGKSIFYFILYIGLISPALAHQYVDLVIGYCWLGYFWILILGLIILGFSCSYYSIKYYLMRREDEIIFKNLIRIFLLLPFILMAFGMSWAITFISLPLGLIMWTVIVIFPITVGILFSISNYYGRLPQKEIGEFDNYYDELIEEELREMK